MADTTRRAIEILETLVGFDTTSHLSNLPIIDFISAYLAEHGVASTLVPADDEPKASLYASIGYSGPGGPGGVALSAHTDVVPVAGQDWSTDPFKLVEKDGKLYGRGACDMKGFLAATLALVPDYVARDLSQPIHLAYSYDEEVGCTGVVPMAGRLGLDLPRPDIIIVGEPTQMRPVDAHKSIHAFHTTVTGLEAHSSVLENGVNAIVYGTRFIDILTRLNQRLKREGDASGRFNPGWSTVHVGEIKGGTALNIVPKTCLIHWEIRGLPDEDVPALVAGIKDSVARELIPEMQSVAPNTGIQTQPDISIHPLRPEPGSPAEILVKRLTRSNDVEAVSYGTEAGVFQACGIPTMVCGPGSIEQAHKPDEWLAVSQMEKCVNFLTRLGDELA
ncbi:Acetylornithine deacetylase [hydrothermal vent metagenome]|uniref:Acetylornithine deacetylase n=1 Tax=hydrothermal vent metagenome TaxID=652676 RepID=A0A3B0UAH3_9ZZZZ